MLGVWLEEHLDVVASPVAVLPRLRRVGLVDSRSHFTEFLLAPVSQLEAVGITDDWERRNLDERPSARRHAIVVVSDPSEVSSDALKSFRVSQHHLLDTRLETLGNLNSELASLVVVRVSEMRPLLVARGDALVNSTN